MYQNPPVTVNKCYMCDWTARGLSNAQSIMLDLEFIRNMWVDEGFFNDLGGWHLIPPVVGSSNPSHPLVSSSYQFITWQDTVQWTINLHQDAHFALTEWGRNTHQDLSDFAGDILDGIGQFGQDVHGHIMNAG